MNQDNEELTRLVGRELHGQVDRINDAPIGLADVKGTAHGIRRRRAIGAALGGLGVAVTLLLGALAMFAFLAPFTGSPRSRGPTHGSRPGHG